MHPRLSLLLILFAVGLTSASSISKNNDIDAFADANAMFISMYSDAKLDVLSKYIYPYPLIVVDSKDRELHFYKRSENLKKDQKCQNPLYCTNLNYYPNYFINIKSVVHVPVSMYLIIKSNYIRNKQDKFDSVCLDNLKTLHKKITSGVLDSVYKTFNTSAQDNQDAVLILNQTATFIDESLQNGFIPEQKLSTFLNGHLPAMMRLTNSATKNIMSRIVELVDNWRSQSQISEHAWNNTRVFIHGADTSREDSMEKIAFTWLLGEKREGNRVVYDEVGAKDVDLLDKAAHYTLDVEMSKAIFNVEWRMHRDVMGDAAREYVGLDPVKSKSSLSCPFSHVKEK